jgi:hypothetical protein
MPLLEGIAKRTDLSDPQRDAVLSRAAISFYHLNPLVIDQSTSRRRARQGNSIRTQHRNPLLSD